MTERLAETAFLSRGVPNPSTGYLEWPGAKGRGGYGLVQWKGKLKRVHRLAWEILRGPIPDGMMVCHRCDRTPCYAVDHLFLGTAQDNADDKVAKGRSLKGDANPSRKHPGSRPRGDAHPARLHPELRPRGEKHGRAKLTATQVASIRTAYALGLLSQDELARNHGVTQHLVSLIVRRRIWKSVD
jgi:hypothetical protein